MFYDKIADKTGKKMSKNSICKDLTLLYVEDEEKIRNLLKSAIENEFKEVMTASNGDEGFKKFKKYQPDIIVSDILMPVCNGLDMAKNIREISKDIPIILFTAFSEKEKLLTAIDIGIDKYLIKPVDVDELLSTIEEIASTKLSLENIISLSNNYQFNKTKRILSRNGAEIKLTKKELSFISLLVDNIGSFVSHDDLKKNIWNNIKVNDAAVRTFIKRIRTKTDKEFVENISGLGYKLRA